MDGTGDLSGLVPVSPTHRHLVRKRPGGVSLSLAFVFVTQKKANRYKNANKLAIILWCWMSRIGG